MNNNEIVKVRILTASGLLGEGGDGHLEPEVPHGVIPGAGP